jgi:hypothetical protein
VRNSNFTRSAVTVGVMVALGLPAAAVAVPVAPSNTDGSLKPRTGSLTQVGPINETGYPSWYRDSNGIRLEPCYTTDDEFCAAAPDELPNPDAPVSYPGNFPGEHFYQLVQAEVTGTGVDMVLDLNVEGAWAAEEVVAGDQIVFGRVRIRDKAIADGEYRVTHPYGVDEFVADGDGISYVQDVGITPGSFGGVLNSRVGPFLKWDPNVAPAAPAGYTGDPGINHAVVGSPYATNFVSVEKKNADGTWSEIARTNQFSVQGRYAKNGGVDIQQASYSSSAAGSSIDVYATSDAGQSISIEDTGLGFSQTGLEGDKGVYYGRVDTTQSLDGKSVSVANLSDNPVARKTVKLVDVVTAKAAYNADTHTLNVAASSSDADATPAKLTVLGTTVTAGGTDIPLTVPTATVTVTSDKGGTTTVPVTTAGKGMQAEKPQAAAFANPTDAAPAQKVTLNGTGSLGQITSWTWEQVAATKNEDVRTTDPDTGEVVSTPSTVEVPVTDANRVTLIGGTTNTATFNAPAAEGPLAFKLTVKGPGGETTTTVTVNVKNAAPTTDPGTGTVTPAAVTAAAGADQTVRRGATVTVDGSTSKLADSYAWTQLSGPSVTLAGASTAKATFQFPTIALPTVTTAAGNPTYVKPGLEPVVARLKVTGQGTATSTDDVTITPQAETLQITAAEYRADKREWRISGTSDILAGQRVAVVLGNTLTGRVLGTANVDAVGAWSFRGAGSTAPTAGGPTTVSAVSAQGDDHLAFGFRNR